MTHHSREALADELERQRQILGRELPERVILTALAFAMSAVFVNPLAILALWLCHLATELAGARLLTTYRAMRSAFAYRALIAQSVLVEALYIAAAGLVWQGENPYSKAYAVGMTMTTLMHLATVRSIHLPSGIGGLVGVAVSALLANTTYWIARADMIGLALSTVCCFAALAYALTAMLSNHRLHRSMADEEASARAAHEAKTVFLAQMSHELRTPLNAVVGMAQAELFAATARDDTGESVERLRTLVDSTRVLAVILDDVTDMNAISHGRLQLRPRILALAEEMKTFLVTYHERATRLGILLHIDTVGLCPSHVRIDSLRLRQCLGNLLSNAIRHAPEGSIRVICRSEPLPDGSGGMLVFGVHDTGPGVPEGEREAIFQAFHKGRDAAPGSGLGLAIARNLARRMGGDLQLMPSDSGAFFRLTVGYETALAPVTAPDSLPDFSCRSILVVDDIATNRLVAASYLRAMRARVIEAADGAAALSILASEEVDLVLLDMNMPGLDGFQTAARARMMGGRVAAVPIVAMTADVMEDQIAAIHRAGLDGHLAKPLLPETLAAALMRLL